jgi:hypothetical protein
MDQDLMEIQLQQLINQTTLIAINHNGDIEYK